MQRYDINVDHAGVIDWQRSGEIRKVAPIRSSFAMGLDLIAGHELGMDACPLSIHPICGLGRGGNGTVRKVK